MYAGKLQETVVICMKCHNNHRTISRNTIFTIPVLRKKNCQETNSRSFSTKAKNGKPPYVRLALRPLILPTYWMPLNSPSQEFNRRMHTQIGTIYLLALLHASLYCCVAVAVPDFHVAIKTPPESEQENRQSFLVETGLGVPGTSSVVVEVYNRCKTESSSNRVLLGQFYPTSTVIGISVDHSGVQNLPGTGNSISFTFVEGVAENNLIYSDNGDDATAKVEFCVLVNLYGNN